MAKWQLAGGAILALTVALSPSGYKALKSHEGLGQPGASVQRAYADPYHGWRVATICYGHTAGVKKGDTATLAECEQYLRADVDKHCKLVYDALMPQHIWLTQGEQDAYCSFAYNLGKFKGTDSVYGRLLQQDDWWACMGLLKYYYSNGVPSQSLWVRRYEEYNRCISQLDFTHKR